MFYVSESFIVENLTMEHVIAEIEAMYAAMSGGSARNFPVVREPLGYANAVFGFKSGFDGIGPALGVKAGGYWPENFSKGLTNHQSTVILFDPDSGVPQALVRGNRLTALRTAAASAISVKYLARDEVSTLGILGAGAQAALQVGAALDQRSFTRLLIADENLEQSRKLAQAFSGQQLEIACCSAEQMTRNADVVITVTPSKKAVIQADWVQPGTHLACMGADTTGKQEIDPRLFCRGQAFCDEVAQSITIGECQHAINGQLVQREDIIPIGDVIASRHPGRSSKEEITIFDSTGVGLQDVVAAKAAVRIALELGGFQELD